MSNSLATPWSSNPYAPKVPPLVHFQEKANFSGDLLAAVLYGINVILFFRCMGAFFNPVHSTKEGVKWGLVIHTTAMFSIVTVATAVGLYFQSLAYIDNREFTGSNVRPPGPMGAKYLVSDGFYAVPYIMFQVNQWLADGLLLYRCYIIYGMNFLAIVLPSLTYLATIVFGTLCTVLTLGLVPSIHVNLFMPYFFISLSLNILLTLIIIARVVLHSRNLRNATGNLVASDGMYNTIVTMLVESCALYTVTFLLFVVPWFSSSNLSSTFWPALTEIQVIAPFLIVLRVASRKSFTSRANISRNSPTLRFRSTYDSQ